MPVFIFGKSWTETISNRPVGRSQSKMKICPENIIRTVEEDENRLTVDGMTQRRVELKDRELRSALMLFRVSSYLASLPFTI